jgi:hypothetical protein
MLALIPQSGDSSGAALGVRSVALLQIPKLPTTHLNLFPQKLQKLLLLCNNQNFRVKNTQIYLEISDKNTTFATK